MKRSFLVVAVLMLSVSLFLTVSAERAGAQAPRRRRFHRSAGKFELFGLAIAPVPSIQSKWVKKDKGPKNSPIRTAAGATSKRS